MGLFRGLFAPLRGAAFIARHRLWGYVLLPAVLNAALAVGAGKLASDFVAARWHGGWPWAAAFVVAVLLFLTVQPIVSAPFLDALSERTERIVRGEHASVGLWKGILLALVHGCLKTMLFVVALTMTAGLTMLTGVGGLIGAGFAALFLAYDGLDYPLARRIPSFSGKWSYLLRNPGLTLGYAVSASVLYLVPLAAILAPAFCAVGATLAYLSQENLTAPAEPQAARDAPG